MSRYSIDKNRFNNTDYIDKRVKRVPVVDRGSVTTALKYLYDIKGIENMPRNRMINAEPYLSIAEKIVIRWLQSRTNGNSKKDYGKNALLEARKARYRCRICKNDDVRVLTLDHVNGRGDDVFQCICANCHQIKSRKHDWAGK